MLVSSRSKHRAMPLTDASAGALLDSQVYLAMGKVIYFSFEKKVVRLDMATVASGSSTDIIRL